MPEASFSFVLSCLNRFWLVVAGSRFVVYISISYHSPFSLYTSKEIFSDYDIAGSVRPLILLSLLLSVDFE